jgi:hypothetical protein
MYSENSIAPNEEEPGMPEPMWVTVTLRFLPVPIFAFVISAITAAIAAFCFIFAHVDNSSIGLMLGVLFAALSGLIAWASFSRFLRTKTVRDVPANYTNSERLTAGAIIAFMICVYSWLLAIGLTIFRSFFAANRALGTKYYVTLGIALASSLYMSFHGRRLVQQHFGPSGRGGNIALTPAQALLIVVMVLAFAAYFAWIMD